LKTAAFDRDEALPSQCFSDRPRRCQRLRPRRRKYLLQVKLRAPI